MIDAVGRHPAVRSVRLVGSRADSRANERSDWDFAVETEEFPRVAAALPELLAPLEPLAQQWDPLGERRCWMAMLRGPVKIDLIFDEPQTESPPWRPGRETLEPIQPFAPTSVVGPRRHLIDDRQCELPQMLKVLELPLEPADPR